MNARQEHSHSLDSLLTQSLNISYGITDDLSLIANFPFRAFFGLETTAEGFLINDGSSIGFGDFSFLAKYKFLDRNNFSLAAIAGVKIPSGDTNQKNEFGFLLSPDTQPGSGSWDPIMGLAATKSFKSFDLHSSVLYQLSTPGSQDTIVGDNLSYNLALTKKLSKHVEFVTELNGLWREKVETNGIKDSNHGGHIIFATPGLRININEHLLNSIYLSLPLIQDINGYQAELNFQLGFNTTIIF